LSIIPLLMLQSLPLENSSATHIPTSEHAVASSLAVHQPDLMHSLNVISFIDITRTLVPWAPHPNPLQRRRFLETAVTAVHPAPPEWKSGW